MAFNDTYRESIQDKHSSNVGFTSTAKGITNEGYPTKNPHQVLASQIPVIDVVNTYGPLVASGIAAGIVEKHVVKLTADPTVNNNKAWVAYEDNCTETGHSGRGHIRLDVWMRYAETQYKLRLFADDGSGNPDYGTEILPSETNFNWEYDPSAGVVYFDDDPTTHYTSPLWGVFYKYVGETVYDKIDTTTSGSGGSAYSHISDGINTHNAQPDDTIYFASQGGASVTVNPATGTVTISGGSAAELVDVDLNYNSGVWEYNGGLSAVPSDLQVFLNGNKNREDAEYYTATVVGGVLRITFAFTTHPHDWVNCTWSNPVVVGGGMHDWVVVTANAAVNNKDRIIIDSTSSSFTITLPSGPLLGWMISFLDGAGNCNTNNVTLDRNGSNIMGSASDLVIDTDNANFTLVYYDSSNGWRLID